MKRPDGALGYIKRYKLLNRKPVWKVYCYGCFHTIPIKFRHDPILFFEVDLLREGEKQKFVDAISDSEIKDIVLNGADTVCHKCKQLIIKVYKPRLYRTKSIKTTRSIDVVRAELQELEKQERQEMSTREMSIREVLASAGSDDRKQKEAQELERNRQELISGTKRPDEAPI